MNIVLINTWRVINAKGGAEKVFCEMANALTRRGYDVTALCCEEMEGKPGFSLENRVRFINAGQVRVPFSLSKFSRKIRCLTLNSDDRKRNRSRLESQYYGLKFKEALHSINPDIFICFQIDSAFAVRHVYGNSVPVITMLHCNPIVLPLLRLFPEEVSYLGPVQILMPEYADIVRKMVPKAKLVHIPNAVPQFSYTADRRNKKIIHVGRVDRGKRQHFIVHAFSILKDMFPDWTVELWGELDRNAEYTSEIRTLIQKFGLVDRVRLCGTTDNIPSVLSRASIFAFPSDNEGFPLALTEAMSMGLPPIGCREASSVSSLIRNEENGLLIDSNPQSLADALKKLMQDEALRIQLGEEARRDMMAYSPESIWDQWESLIKSSVTR